MTREEYLAQLRALLTGRTPPDELERILAYYTEYFDEAGPQGEGRVRRSGIARQRAPPGSGTAWVHCGRCCWPSAPPPSPSR